METEYRVLTPVLRVGTPRARPITEYASKLKIYIDAIRLMTVEVKVIEMITSRIIPKMSFEERNQLDQDLLEINEEREEECEKTLDLSKSFEDHFHEVEINS